MSYFSEIKNKVHKLKNLLYFKSKQKIFRDECKIKYLFEKHESSNNLIISFAGLPSKNMPATYQYMRTLENQKMNKLFILDDFGPSISGGSFYLAKNNNFEIERSVEKLINNIMNQLSIPKENVITIGSSKGGFAAVYYAMKYHYGTAIAGEPQIYLGEYLNKPGNLGNLLNYIMGNNDDNNVSYLNSLIIDTVKENNKKTKLYLLCGENGYYHKNHISPFIKELNKYDMLCSLELGKFGEHKELPKYYPEFLLKTLNEMKIQEETSHT